MNLLAPNLILALLWVSVTGQFSFLNFGFGFVLGFCVLALSRPLLRATSYFRRLAALLDLALHFVGQLIGANIRVAWEVMSPRQRAAPSIFLLPLELTRDLEIVTFANLISLTPGTLSLGVTTDRRHLVVHSMFGDEDGAVERELKEGLERRLIRIMRP